MNASMTCTRWARISVTMWMTRNASAPNETARCTACAITLCPGVITVRSVATKPFVLSYKPADALSGAGTAQDPKTFNFHDKPASVMAPHSFSAVLVQACVAILLLVGFESVSAMGEKAHKPTKNSPDAI